MNILPRSSFSKTVGALVFATGLAFSSVAMADCMNPDGESGAIFYNTDQNVPQTCVGGAWVALGALNPAAGSGSCASPVGQEGTIVYNDTYDVLQYCDGSDWQAIAKAAGKGTHIQFDCPEGTGDGLIGHWKFDESSGTTAVDTAGSNDGTLNGDPVWRPTGGILGGALEFDEAGDYVQIPDLAYGAEFTITFWYKPADHTGSDFQYMYSHGAVSSNNSVNVYCVEESNGGTSAGDLVGNFRASDGTPNDNMYARNKCEDSEWHLVAIRSFSSNGFNYFFADGTFQYTYYDASGAASANPATDIYVGGREDLNSARFFGGLIDDLRIYNRFIGSDEIASLYFSAASCNVN